MRYQITAILAAFVFTAALVLPNAAVAATVPAEPIRVMVNGRELATDVAPMIQSGRVLVPARPIFAAMGAEMDWNPKTGVAAVTWGERRLLMQSGSRAAWIDRELVLLEVAPTVITDRLLVPLRYIGSALGAQILWDAEQGIIMVDGRLAVSRDARGGALAPPESVSDSSFVHPALQQMVATAISVEGRAYRWGSSGPNSFDCSGFTQYVFRKIGVSLPASSFMQYERGTPIARADLQPGDLVFFSTYTGGASHVGIYLTGGKFISAESALGIHVAELGSSYWSARYLGARRYDLLAAQNLVGG